MSKTNFEVHMKHLNGAGKMKLMMKFELCLHNFFELAIHFLKIPAISGNYSYL